MPASARPGETVRQMLDYICWITQEMQTLGAHGGGDLPTWRRAVGLAYQALVNPMLPGYGDPYPMDVPPARSPGLWPDIAAADIPGMTVRHQLVVVGMLAEQARAGVGLRARPEMLADLEARITRARGALDHGPTRPLPEEARTQPSPTLLAAARAEEKAIREHARRRTRRVRDLLSGRGSGPRPKGSSPKPGRPTSAASKGKPARKSAHPGAAAHKPQTAKRRAQKARAAKSSRRPVKSKRDGGRSRR